MVFSRGVGILGTGSYLPEEVITNEDLEKIVETSDAWITSRTGIKERRRVAAHQATSDLCYQAALRALDSSGVSADELDLIIVGTASPDMLFPSTACLLQNMLGAKKAAAFDLEAACTGFIYGLAVGSQFIATGMYDKVLVVGADTLSRLLDWEDRNTCVLFGDGAGACVLGQVEQGQGILSLYLGADGGGGDLLKLPAGGSRLPASEQTVAAREHFIKMSGTEVFKFAVRVMDEAAKKALEQAGITKKDIDFLVPHQANIRIVDAAVRRLDLSPERVYVNLDKYGNMSGGSVPVALDEAVNEGKIKNGDVVLLVGFGAGLTWGSVVMTWTGSTVRGGK
ncbi:beta-ketoacyl-ACP synthase III [Metallumcola ferriviriculae]|uniref:beta-ketoacyl-ACP synthase III n=1 Tax=Metallumcola ferriviriculae TaxID=3039180 RepID=UPI00345A35A7